MKRTNYLSFVLGYFLFCQYVSSSPIKEDDNNKEDSALKIMDITSYQEQYSALPHNHTMEREDETQIFLKEVTKSIILLRRELYSEDKKISELSPKSRLQVLTSPQFSQMKMELQALEGEAEALFKSYSTLIPQASINEEQQTDNITSEPVNLNYNNEA
jgi:hypothetical protein